MVRAMLLSAGLPPNLWCYAVESSADVYRYTYHSALDKHPMRLGMVLNRMLTTLAYGVVMFTFSIQIPRSWITELFMVISLALQNPVSLFAIGTRPHLQLNMLVWFGLMNLIHIFMIVINSLLVPLFYLVMKLQI
jgi:hypothetical protein